MTVRGFFICLFKHTHIKDDQKKKIQIHYVTLNFPQENVTGYGLRALTTLWKILPQEQSLFIAAELNPRD